MYASVYKHFPPLFIVINCTQTPPGVNTEPIPVESKVLQYLESYTYSCKEGYTTNDPLCTVCQANGTLSIPAPACHGEYLQAA